MDKITKTEEAILSILQIEEAYEKKETFIEYEGRILNKKEVMKIIESLADKEDDSDYWAFVSLVKRKLSEAKQ